MGKSRRHRSDRAGRAPMRSPGRPSVGRRVERQRFWAPIAGGLSSEPHFDGLDRLDQGEVPVVAGSSRSLEDHGLQTGRSRCAASSAYSRRYRLTGFQANGVIFPTRGCWTITGSAGKATLSFVTLVATATRERRRTYSRAAERRVLPGRRSCRVRRALLSSRPALTRRRPRGGSRRRGWSCLQEPDRLHFVLLGSLERDARAEPSGRPRPSH